MAPNFLTKFVKAATTTNNAHSTTPPTNETKTDSPRRSASRDRPSKPPKSRRTSSSETASPAQSTRSSFQIGISTLTRAASRNRSASSPANHQQNVDSSAPSFHRKAESVTAVPPVPPLPDNLTATPAPRARRNSIISVVFGGGKNDDNSSIVPPQRQPEPSSVDSAVTRKPAYPNTFDDDDDDSDGGGIPTIITVASASRESVTTNTSSQLGVTIIPPSPLVYSSSLPSTHSTSVDNLPAAVEQGSPEAESIERGPESATTPTAEAPPATSTTASVLVSLFGRRPRTSSISSAISGIIGYGGGGVAPKDRPSDIDTSLQDLGSITATPTPTTAKAYPNIGKEPPPLPSQMAPSASQTINTSLAPAEVRRKTSSRSLTNVPPPIHVPDPTGSSTSSKQRTQHARAATSPAKDVDSGTVTMKPIVDSPDALKTEFGGISPSTSNLGSANSVNSSRNRAASASTSAQSNGTFSSMLLSPRKGGDDDTASIISTTSKSPDKKRLFKRSTSRKPTGLASAIAASGLAMANPSISAIHSNGAAAAVQNASNTTSPKKDTAVTSKGNPPGTVPYMVKTPGRSATTISSARSPRSVNSTGRKASGGSGRSPSSSSFMVNSAGSKKHRRRPSSPGHSDATSNGGLSAGRPGSEYYSGNESEGARSRISRDSDSDSEDETDSGDDSSDDLLDGLDLDDEEMPVTGFAVASNKRNADFHELFGSIPEGDYLIEDYGCALQREILIQGRLYISENHICFHANIFGWITDLSIPIDEITSLEKKMTAFVIPNAIQLTTRQARYTFASFLSRDTTYDVIYNIWRLARPDDIQSTRGSLDIVGVTASGSAIYGTGESAGSISQISGVEGGAVAAAPRKPLRKATQCACGREGRHYTETALEATFPGSPEMIHNLIFASGFIKDFLAVNQKLLDIQMSDWSPATEGSNLLTRNMSYIKPLNAPMGPKQTKCEIRDEMEHVNFEDYISTVTTTRTPDVPSGGVFSVKTRTCIMWAGHASAKVLVTTQVEWSGRSYIKGIIERSAIAGQKVFHGDLEKAMRAYIQEHISEFVPEGSDALELAVEEQATETAAIGGVAAGTEGGTASATEISQQEREKQREQERNQRAWQWAWDTFEGAFDVAKQSTKTALDLVRDAWDQSSSTTILYFIIVILVISNLYTMIRMGKKEEVGRRKEMMKAEEREKWVQSVVSTLWEELAAGKKEAVELREEYLKQGHAAVVARERQEEEEERAQVNGGVLPSSLLADLPPLPTPEVVSPVAPGSWRDEVAHLHHTLEMVEERAKAIKQTLAQFEKIDTLD